MSEIIQAFEELIIDPKLSHVRANNEAKSIFESFEVEDTLLIQMPVLYIGRMFLPSRDDIEHQAYLIGGHNGVRNDVVIPTPFHIESDPFAVRCMTFMPGQRLRIDVNAVPSHNTYVGVEMSRLPMIEAGRLLFRLTMMHGREL